MPQIVVDLSYFEPILFAATPAEAALEIIRRGGWVLIVIPFFWGLWRIWVESRQIKWSSAVETVILAIDVPKATEQTPKAVEHIFEALQGTLVFYDKIEKYWHGKIPPSFSFEIASIDGHVQYFVRTWSRYRDLVEAAIYAQYPDAEIAEVSDYTSAVPDSFPAEGWDLFGIELGLAKASPYPIRTYPLFEDSISGEIKDPVSGLLELLSKLRTGEQLWLQFLIMPDTGEGIRAEGLRLVNKLVGRKGEQKQSLLDKGLGALGTLVGEVVDGLFGGEAPPQRQPMEMPSMLLHITEVERKVVENIQMKLDKLLFRTKIRIIYVGREEAFAKARTISGIKGVFGQYARLDLNSFRIQSSIVTKADYWWQRKSWVEPITLYFTTALKTRQNRILRAYRQRNMGYGPPPFFLNTEELASLYHFPSLIIKAPLLKKTEAKRAEAPFRLPMPPSRAPEVPLPETARAPAEARPSRSVRKPSPSPAPLPSADSSPPSNLPFV